MLSSLLSFFDRTPRSTLLRLPRWVSYLDQLQANAEQLINRNLRSTDDPIPSEGIDFINSLITRADIPHLMKFEHDVDLLRQVHREVRSPVYSELFRQNPLKDQFFLATSYFNSPEFVLVTEDLELEDELPLGDDNIENWLKVRPLRILEVDSNEVSLDITVSRIRYRYLPPNRAVFSINITKLLMLYVKYRRARAEEFELGIHNFPFIFKTCIAPLLLDNIRTYAITIITDLIVGKLSDPNYELREKDYLHSTLSSFLVSSRGPAFSELNDIVTKCMNRRVKADEVMNSVMVSPDVSLISHINWIIDHHYIGHGGRQYEWIIWLRDRNLLYNVVTLYSFDPDSVRSRELFKLMRIMTLRMERTRFWSQARPRFLAKQIEEDFKQLKEIVDNS